MPVPLRLLTSLLLSAGLLACQSETPSATAEAEPPITVSELRMPASGFDGITEIIDRMVIIDDYGDDSAQVPGMVMTLRSLRVTSSAYFRYLLQRGGEPRLMKVKIIVFESDEAAAADWKIRNHQDVLPGTRALTLGDEALNLQDQKYLIRVGQVQLEIGRKDDLELLEAFSRAYVQFVSEQLRTSAGS